MSAGLPDAERAELGSLFDVLVPEAEGMLAASAVGCPGSMLDRVLNFRPDLRESIIRTLAEARGQDAEAYVRSLADRDPECFRALGIVVAPGYYMADEVRDQLGYHGQLRSAFDPHETPEYMTEGLLQRVVDRGPIWRDPGA